MDHCVEAAKRISADDDETAYRETPSISFLRVAIASAPVFTPRGGLLSHRNFGERWERRFQPSPNPTCDILSRGVLQPFNLVQVSMIELFKQRPERSFDFREVDQPAGFGVNLALTGNLHIETVPVHPAAFVPRRGVREPMSSVKREVADQPDLATEQDRFGCLRGFYRTTLARMRNSPCLSYIQWVRSYTPSFRSVCKPTDWRAL